VGNGVRAGEPGRGRRPREMGRDRGMKIESGEGSGTVV
jgi:hypothetical protein